jgi:hypothetical protein
MDEVENKVLLVVALLTPFGVFYAIKFERLPQGSEISR